METQTEEIHRCKFLYRPAPCSVTNLHTRRTQVYVVPFQYRGKLKITYLDYSDPYSYIGFLFKLNPIFIFFVWLLPYYTKTTLSLGKRIYFRRYEAETEQL